MSERMHVVPESEGMHRFSEEVLVNIRGDATLYTSVNPLLGWFMVETY